MILEKKERYRIQFPRNETHTTGQDEVYFFLIENGKKKTLRFHDYDKIYSCPGLYEQLFYDRLKCTSPKKVVEILKHAVRASEQNFSELRVLDFGAGNGMVGEELKRDGVARLIGVDILPEARESAIRDRPTVYDAYYVADFTQLEQPDIQEFESWSIDCLITVAALGFGDIPPRAFFQALQLVQEGGWIAFNIKDSFFNDSDKSGFSRLIKELIFSDYLDIHHIERYRHRLSMEGTPLYYFALVARKSEKIPDNFLENIEPRSKQVI